MLVKLWLTSNGQTCRTLPTHQPHEGGQILRPAGGQAWQKDSRQVFVQSEVRVPPSAYNHTPPADNFTPMVNNQAPPTDNHAPLADNRASLGSLLHFYTSRKII